jgi:hypothetical protein
LERRLELKPNNQDIAAQLKLIMWVFTAADEGQSPSFLSKLHSAYFEACAQPRGNRDDS